ncbi:MBL fold metallo-hydrolase [Actinocorallia herbida]|uniref:MBL fold metallo-hydrolase n=1 Tax=Actinocorallia herbida TaxID=58109 RepID=UPI001FE84471|nr:MBL fold metallo-hydrolase [Actinocorallia herbida]
MPLPGAPGYVLVYVLESDRGPYLVDAGWDTPEALVALEAGLAEIGTAVGEVQGVLATHAHLDHFGIAGRVRALSGAWVGLHPADVPVLRHFASDPAGRVERLMRRAGAPEDAIAGAVDNLGRAPLDLPMPDVELRDGAWAPVPGRRLRTIWTPGHSPGHLCFWEEGQRLLFSGDHVLPRIVAGLPEPSTPEHDPLGDCLDSLDKVRDLPAEEILAAHEHRFTGLPGRVAEIKEFHEDRIARALAAVGTESVTAWEVAAGDLRRSRPLADLRGFALSVALSEAMACLKLLARRGLVVEHGGATERWSRPGLG